MERQVKGIWIPIEVWMNRKLSWHEIILLMEIDSFSSNDKPCFISNEYISKMFKVSEATASTYMKHLIENGYVEVVRFDGRTRFVQSCLKADLKKTLRQTNDGFDATNNKNTNISSDKSDDNNRKGLKFIIPTLEEIKVYCRERNNQVDADTFFNYYESNGWMVGKNKMKDWKAAVRTWERNNRTRVATRPVQKETAFQRTLKTLDQVSGTNYYEQAYGKKEVIDEQ